MQPAKVRVPDAPAVLVIDDSAVARAVIVRALRADDRFVVAAAVSDAGAALKFLAANTVAAIVLDLEMPGVDGYAALPELLAAANGAPVLVVSSSCATGAAATIRALALGAADTLVKPGAGRFGADFGAALADRIGRLVADPAANRTPAAGPIARAYDAIAIGASTGGINALSQILGALPPELTLPIVITQHLPAGFMPYFAAQLALLARRPCSVAGESSRLEPGRILVAPGDAHLRLVRTSEGAAVRLTRERAPSGCCPSVDPMLDSAAAVFGPRLLAVVLSGMGRDGAIGAQAVAAAGGSVVVQDQDSSVIWGMPGAVVRAGIAHAVLPPDAIGALIAGGRRAC